MADKKDDYFIELNHDLGYRSVHLGKGFILDGNEDRPWAEHLVTMGDAKKVDKPDYPIEKPWLEVAKARLEAAKAVPPLPPHPSAAPSFNAPSKK